MSNREWIDENSILAVLSPVKLILYIVIILLAAYLCIKKYRDTNDFKKGIRLYLGISTGIGIVYYAMGIPVILIIAIIFAGFVAGALFSNHFFYR